MPGYSLFSAPQCCRGKCARPASVDQYARRQQFAAFRKGRGGSSDGYCGWRGSACDGFLLRCMAPVESVDHAFSNQARCLKRGRAQDQAFPQVNRRSKHIGASSDTAWKVDVPKIGRAGWQGAIAKPVNSSSPFVQCAWSGGAVHRCGLVLPLSFAIGYRYSTLEASPTRRPLHQGEH